MPQDIQNQAQTPGQQPALIGDKDKSPTDKGTGFVNLSKYLQANQGNQLGNAVSGNIAQAGQKASNDLSNQQQQFGQSLQSARSGIAQNQGTVNNAFGQIDAGQNYAPTANEVQTFGNLRTQQYAGPTGYANPEQLQQEAAQAANLGQLSQSRGGRQELLRQTVQAPGYTNSQQRLDELLMSLGGGGQQVQQAGHLIQKLPAQVNKQVEQSSGQGQSVANQYHALQNLANSGVQGRTAQISGAIDKQAADAAAAEQNRQQNLAAFQNALRNENIGQANIYQQQGNLFDPSQYAKFNQLIAATPVSQQNDVSQQLLENMSPGYVPLSRGQSATANQRAQIDALNQLSGGTREFQNFTPEQAQQANFGKFDVDALLNAINAQKNSYHVDNTANVGTGNEQTTGISNLRRKLG